MFFYDNPIDENSTASPPDNLISLSFEVYGIKNETNELSPKNVDKNFESKDAENEETRLPFKPRILLMGLPRSGKSSIQNVVFHKMTPNETFFLEATKHLIKNDIKNSPLLQFQLWDYPGQSIKNMFDSQSDAEKLFKNCDAIIFVMDAQDDNSNPLSLFVATMLKSRPINPHLKYQLFIHKIDGLTDEQKIETQRSIYHILREDMDEPTLKDLYVKFYMTSIYDYSIYEAVSKVVQQLIPQLPTLENLLNIFITGSGIEKVFLCDVVSKIYIATDSNPVDMQTYELCCDMIDVVIDLSCIYGMPKDKLFCPFDDQSQSIIRLNTSAVLYLREVNKYLALVCIIRESNFKKHATIDFQNFDQTNKSA
ncbi:ras-related GTP-binding protein C-like isoform X2 [Gordionus sp. m RMFG-2023]|uniref:ras-related GTP-binding protein C-like isoform X2 n=1 Tax=Gordionus sp. m RMFG-2023 TaxID=3053472 RepID=UPI0031FBB2B2